MVQVKTTKKTAEKVKKKVTKKCPKKTTPTMPQLSLDACMTFYPQRPFDPKMPYATYRVVRMYNPKHYKHILETIEGEKYDNYVIPYPHYVTGKEPLDQSDKLLLTGFGAGSDGARGYDVDLSELYSILSYDCKLGHDEIVDLNWPAILMHLWRWASESGVTSSNLKAFAAVGVTAWRKGETSSGDTAMSLDKDDVTILATLETAKHYCWDQYSLELNADVSRRTLSKRLPVLYENGVVHYPKGPRGGVQITEKGSNIIQSMPRKLIGRIPLTTDSEDM